MNLDLTILETFVRSIGSDPTCTIPLLQAVQNEYRYVPAEAITRLSELTGIDESRFRRVVKFFHSFRTEPAGQHTICVCHGTACHVKGAPAITDALHRHLNIPEGKDTDPTGKYTVQRVACLGCCTLAPAVKIDEITYGHLTPHNVDEMLDTFEELLAQGDQGSPAVTRDPDDVDGEILISLDSCCISRGCGEVHIALQQALADTHARARIKPVGCVSMCYETPLVEVKLADGTSHRYARVTPDDAAQIVRTHFPPQGLWNKLRTTATTAVEAVLTDDGWGGVEQFRITPRDPHIESFFAPQQPIANEHSGDTDPLDLEEYLRLGGFSALRKCVREGDRDAVIDLVGRAGLRGRGGAGFHSATKWRYARDAASEKKYAICNGDEGDPGAFMDRMLLESHPYRIIEGLAIAAWAIGADEAILYIRWEYPVAVLRMKVALQLAETAGLLDKAGVTIRVFEGAGAFVCGEETALIESLEGKPGYPRNRPPYPTESGFLGCPTLVNNVETLANVPWILRNGPDAFSAIGTGDSAGTKVFALAGKVHRGGLIEVPMGTTIREIVYDIGGGIEGGRMLKAVQIGGPSGGCIPASQCDIAIDFEALHTVGGMMGSGGLVILDETDCMVDVARYFMEFIHTESCGKCPACKGGSKRMLDILTDICQGKGSLDDIAELHTLARAAQTESLCALGTTAPNPVLTTLRYFADEYRLHIQGWCPTGKCPELTTLEITTDCIGCTKCAQNCPVGAITATPHEMHVIDTAACVHCNTCVDLCPVGAVLNLPRNQDPAKGSFCTSNNCQTCTLESCPLKPGDE